MPRVAVCREVVEWQSSTSCDGSFVPQDDKI
jgi:hypothetical protein